MMEADLLLSMYNEQVAQARQHENLRAAATNLTFVAGSVLVSLLFKDGQPVVSSEAAAATLIGIGLFGALFSLKHYERNRFHVAIARRYRKKLEELIPAADISKLRQCGRHDNETKYPVLSKLSLNWLWTSSSLAFVVVGISYLLWSG